MTAKTVYTHVCPACKMPMTQKQATGACYGPTRAFHPATRPVRVAS